MLDTISAEGCKHACCCHQVIISCSSMTTAARGSSQSVATGRSFSGLARRARYLHWNPAVFQVQAFHKVEVAGLRSRQRLLHGALSDYNPSHALYPVYPELGSKRSGSANSRQPSFACPAPSRLVRESEGWSPRESGHLPAHKDAAEGHSMAEGPAAFSMFKLHQLVVPSACFSAVLLTRLGKQSTPLQCALFCDTSNPWTPIA